MAARQVHTVREKGEVRTLKGDCLFVYLIVRSNPPQRERVRADLLPSMGKYGVSHLFRMLDLTLHRQREPVQTYYLAWENTLCFTSI